MASKNFGPTGRISTFPLIGRPFVRDTPTWVFRLWLSKRKPGEAGRRHAVVAPNNGSGFADRGDHALSFAPDLSLRDLQDE